MALEHAHRPAVRTCDIGPQGVAREEFVQCTLYGRGELVSAREKCGVVGESGWNGGGGWMFGEPVTGVLFLRKREDEVAEEQVGGGHERRRDVSCRI